MMDHPAYEITGELDYMAENKIKIREFGCDFSNYNPKKKINVHLNTIEFDHIVASYPKYKFFRYREKMGGKAPKNLSQIKKFKFLTQNEDGFVEQIVNFLVNLPKRQCASFNYEDVTHFLTLAYPFCNIRVVERLNCCRQVNGTLNRHAPYFSTCHSSKSVRVVGELRGDFEALRKILNIPSNLSEQNKNHPTEDYDWVFMGNYATGHPQGLETLILLFGLQYIFGKERFVLLQGPYEFKNFNERNGFKDLLKARFPKKKESSILWNAFNVIFAMMPLNCRVLRRAYCTYGGLAEFDTSLSKASSKYSSEDQTIEPDSMNWIKLFSLPNYTVKDYYDNIDTYGGYYFGEELLHRVRRPSRMHMFFNTIPLETGLGYFGECDRSWLYSISSVKGHVEHVGYMTKVAVVAELTEDERLTFNVILNEDQTLSYDEHEKSFSSIESEPKSRKDGGATTDASNDTTALITDPAESGSRSKRAMH